MENYEEDDDEDPYKLCYPDEIYDTIDNEESISPAVMNRPPAPIPRTCTTSEPEECKTYISTGSTQKCTTNAVCSIFYVIFGVFGVSKIFHQNMKLFDLADCV